MDDCLGELILFLPTWFWGLYAVSCWWLCHSVLFHESGKVVVADATGFSDFDGGEVSGVEELVDMAPGEFQYLCQVGDRV